MEFDAFVNYLTDGLPQADKDAVIAALNKDAIKTKATGIRQQSEFTTIESERQRLMAELDGTQDRPGTRAYQKWYSDNFAQIQANAKAIENYDAKFGKGAFAQAVQAGVAPPTDGSTAGLTDAQIRKIYQEEFTKVAPNIASIVKGAGTLVQKHMYAKRTTPIDFEALDKMMGEAQQKGRVMTLEEAYDQWDKPEREKAEKASLDAEVNRRVQEELTKRGASTQFPAAADLTPGSMTLRPDTETKSFDRSALNKDLLNTWMNPEAAAA